MDENEMLLNAYSTDSFRKDAEQIIELIGNELENSNTKSGQKTIERKSPEEQLTFWNNEFVSNQPSSLLQLSEQIMEHSIHFHSKGYMGHQAAVTLPITALTSALIGT